MKQLFGTLISAVLLGFAYVGNALGVEIVIDPSAYTGQWSVDYGPAQRGAAVVSLGNPDATTGAHVISISGAELFFDVSANGKVTARNSASAKGGSGQLTLNTTTVKVDPAGFSGTWGISAGATPKLSGAQSIVLVPGLQYYNFEVGSTGGFVFHIGDDGTVTVQNGLAASGGAGSLTLRR